MKLLLVTGIFPPDHGGPASYVPAVAAALARRGHVIIGVVTLSDRVDVDDSQRGYPVYRTGRAQSRVIRMLQVVYRIWTLARKADCVYLNGLVLEGILACKLLSRRYVVVKVVGDLIWEKARNNSVFHAGLEEFQTARLTIIWRSLRLVRSWYTGCADAVICPSQYLARLVVGWGVDESKIQVVYNSIEPRRTACGSMAEVSADIVTVARLVPWKGVVELVEIVARYGWSLRIVGDGPLRATIDEHVRRLGVSSSVSLVGQVNHEQVQEEIRKAKVFVLNSSYEGLPHIVLEAKQAGIPVVATRAGGTPEVIDDGVNGFLVQPGNASELARRIAQLLSDGELRLQIALAAKAQVEAGFAFDRMVQNTERVLSPRYWSGLQ